VNVLRGHLSVMGSDLSYVENRSLVQDLVIVRRTWKAVIRPEGAYRASPRAYSPAQQRSG
jgi:hypothetical protein